MLSAICFNLDKSKILSSGLRKFSTYQQTKTRTLIKHYTVEQICQTLKILKTTIFS